jgi:hypothetical protein
VTAGAGQPGGVGLVRLGADQAVGALQTRPLVGGEEAAVAQQAVAMGPVGVEEFVLEAESSMPTSRSSWCTAGENRLGESSDCEPP